MGFQYGGTILDLCVLALVAREDTYGYKLTHEVKETLNVSESTLYPVLRRLTKEQCLSTYDKPFDGRNRRYYTITPQGRDRLKAYERDWKAYIRKVEDILERSHV
ncbi:PadR family transcriptional regulator [uncultured Dubosiella sp.]|uniref:PadR family transcriptional regulator n=1 Tax=uncultured Dubosiella sp. TaxID=1937011 RepID=UPI0025918816|nr:PadR family transcriptional regulator [uncultured Dubosiella sp.]